MTAPTHISTTNTAVGPAFELDHEWDLPATVTAGDMLIALVTMNYAVATPGPEFADWDLITTDKLHDYHKTWVYARIASGAEAGGTLTFTVPSSCNSACQVLRISGTYLSSADGVGIHVAKLAARSWGTTGDPPSATAPWGAADNLFIAVDQIGGHDSTIVTWPAGYSTNQSQPSAVARHLSASASKTVTATATDNPGTFATATDTIHKGMTIVVRPDAAAAYTPTPAAEAGEEPDGATIAGDATVAFDDPGGGNQVESDIRVLWDFDNDGDFDLAAEDVTGDVLSAEVSTGRDFPSQLAGKATPGVFIATLRNDDDQYWPSNTASPLNTAPLSLANGRKLRVRIAEAGDPEPTLLMSDRMGTSGSVTATEQGGSWAPVIGADWDVTDGAAQILATGEGHLVTDVAADLYTQARWRHCDPGNGIGVLYRYENPDNYGHVTIQDGAVTHTVVAAGTPTDHGTATVEIRPHMTIGVLVTADDDVTVYVEGVPLFTDTGDAAATAGTGTGAWVDWATHRSPALEEIQVWDKVWTSEPGIIFTGDVADVLPRVSSGPEKTVQVRAVGWLARAAGPTVLAPTSIGVTAESTAGVTTGLMVGQALASANLLHPPPPDGIAAGSALGAVGTDSAKALYLARLFESAEGGLLFEHPEGPVGFADDAARVDRDVIACLSDVPGAQFSPETIEPLDWRREVFNRAQAEVSPTTPVLEVVLTESGDHGAGATALIEVTMPTSGQANVGDLAVVLIVAACQLDGESIEAPTGWVQLGTGGGGTGKERWFARTLTASVIGATVTFYAASGAGGGAWLARTFVVSGWYGAVESGVALSEPAGETGATAQAGTVDPPTLLVPWGVQNNLYLATKSGMYTATSGAANGTDPDDAPNGYRGLDADAVAATVATADVGSMWAWRHAVTGIESPSPFGGTFTGFDFVESSTVAIRGYAGSPPAATGGEVVEVDDLDSQSAHNVVSTYPDVARFQPSVAAAGTHAAAVLAYYSGSKPLLRAGWHATRSELYRWLAYSLRVSDLVRVNATGNTGIGVNALYYVEALRHRWDEGATRWWCEIELSPAE